MSAATQASLQINNFDLLRLFAALQVVLTHCVIQLSLEPAGWHSFISLFHGVPIFFVISGFLISASWESNPDLLTFIKNRVLRIMPGLWASIMVVVLVAMLFGYKFDHIEGISWFLLQLVGAIYTPAFLEGYGHGSYNGSLWTIPVELQFYCLIPFIYWFTAAGSKKTKQLLFAVIVLFVVSTFYTMARSRLVGDNGEPLSIKLLRYSFVPHVFLFLYGIVLQRVSVHTHWLLRGKAHWWIVGYTVYCYLSPNSTWLAQFQLIILGTASISCAYTLPTLAKTVLGRIDISYGVYVYHGIILNVFIQCGWIAEWHLVPLVVFLSCSMGFVSWVGIERPCIRRKSYSVRKLLHTPNPKSSRADLC